MTQKLLLSCIGVQIEKQGVYSDIEKLPNYLNDLSVAGRLQSDPMPGEQITTVQLQED